MAKQTGSEARGSTATSARAAPVLMRYEMRVLRVPAHVKRKAKLNDSRCAFPYAPKWGLPPTTGLRQLIKLEDDHGCLLHGEVALWINNLVVSYQNTRFYQGSQACL